MSELKPCPVRAFVDDYYFAGDEGDFTPNEWQRAMIEDAIHGYLAEQPSLSGPSAEHVEKLVAYLDANGDDEAAELVRNLAAASRPTPIGISELADEQFPELGIHVPLREYFERTLAGLFGRQPDMSGDQRKRLLGHERARVESFATELLAILTALSSIQRGDG